MDDGPGRSQCPELEDHDCEKDQLQANLEIVWDLLLQLDLYKPMGPDGMHPRILKRLADAIAKALLMIFQWSWKSRDEAKNVLTKKGSNPAELKLAGVPLHQILLLANYQYRPLAYVPEKQEVINRIPKFKRFPEF
ncbi:hypothetical protein WISP_74685 [Willisornis vidua]|uniref:Uncharacterized protein n=1 Tax=Willisornis vidua TaxID=1566151 RepID=A0ABQ9DCE0_9PASS|nr:hypothetical protein WISP_74685 [Willisornis vidua]